MKSLTFAIALLVACFGRLNAEYVSANGFKKCCQFVLDQKNQKFSPKDVKNGDAIYIRSNYLHLFFEYYHPQITAKYILVTHFSDLSIPSKWASFLDDPKLIAWFGINVEGKAHDKLIPIPIGFSPGTLENSDQIAILEGALERAQKTEKVIPLYLNFKFWKSQYDPTQERAKVFHLFKDKPYCVVALKRPFQEYLDDLGRSEFVLCPRGAGIDCYRTWESILMGAIPIVKHSALDPLFVDLPVLIVSDWSEVNEKLLAKKYGEIKAKSANLDKLQMSFWAALIDSYRRP